jgi:hypothetical protein
MVKVVSGYYVRDTGDGDVVYFFAGGEPPLEQYVLRDGTWHPLPDGFYLMDKLIDGDPDFYGPVADPPAGVPPVRSGSLLPT